jgi:hypothetical protein
MNAPTPIVTIQFPVAVADLAAIFSALERVHGRGLTVRTVEGGLLVEKPAAVGAPVGLNDDDPLSAAQWDGRALCSDCVVKVGRAGEWDTFHYGTREPCARCHDEAMSGMPRAVMPVRRGGAERKGEK